MLYTHWIWSRKTKMRALWSITAKNTDWSTGPLARPFARSLTSLTPLTPSLVGQWMIGWLFCLCFFQFSTIVERRKEEKGETRARRGRRRRFSFMWRGRTSQNKGDIYGCKPMGRGGGNGGWERGELWGKRENEYRKGTFDATTPSSLIVPSIMMLFDDFLLSKKVIFVVQK